MKGRDKRTGRFVSNTNKWVFEGENVYCYLDGELLFFTDDASVVEHTWAKMANGYASTKVDGKQVAAHRFISKPNDDELVDHINRNKKDNRKCNLRNTDKSVNAFNCKRRTTNKSGVTGVWYRKDTNKWCAEIKKDNKKISLGCYENIEDAVKARKKAEELYYAN